VLRLGVASGRISGLEIDTAFFDGNHAPEVALVGCSSASDDLPGEESWGGWETILPKVECGPSRRQAWKFDALTESAYTHVRLQMYPDGGIARFRLFGVAVPVFPEAIDAQLDLAATVNGGVAVQCSDQHFGTMKNLLLPGRGVDMGDGWETKRTRGVHTDWVVVKLGTKGIIEGVVVDTAHFRGNFPKEVQVFAALWEKEGNPDGVKDQWTEILTPQKCQADFEHNYVQAQLQNVQGHGYTHAKIVIIPDGGVKRFKVIGRRAV
jgi:allantoicase